MDVFRPAPERSTAGYLRNPMGLGGLGVGAALGLGLGSWAMLAYVLVGGVMWHTIARPLEERDLLVRFAEPYRRYCAAVRCWIPRIRAYEP